jgi:diguanylate cyclase (GGDEF)-like protein
VEEFVVYADFNCPFCYALNERLDELNGSYPIEWRPIQHMPSIDGLMLAPVTQAQLASEVFTVRHRAPDVPISLPPVWSNSRRATEAYVAASAIDGERAALLRRDIYRALWKDGRDIADPAVIAELLHTNGFDDDVDADIDARLALGEWQRLWEEGPYDERIPTITSDEGRTLLGLSSPNEIEAFFRGQDVLQDIGGVCDFIPRQSIMLIGRLVEVWPFLSALDDQYDIQVMVDGVSALSALENDVPPDLILIEGGLSDVEPMAVCEQILATVKGRDVPTVIFDPTRMPDREKEALAHGAADYLGMDVDIEVFAYRIRRQLMQKQRLDLLRRQATVDGLTRIPNRREFERVAEIEWRRGVRSKMVLTIAMMDIDHFKEFNDHFGHLQGDGCLRQVAETLSDCAHRAGDFFARYGGEEFVAVLPDTGTDSAEKVGERCRMAVEALAIQQDPSLDIDRITISVGLASAVPGPDRDLVNLIKTADDALYEAKAGGRNQVVYRPYPES